MVGNLLHREAALKAAKACETVAGCLAYLVDCGLLEAGRKDAVKIALDGVKERTTNAYAEAIIAVLGDRGGDVAEAIAAVQVRCGLEQRCVLVSAWGIFISRGEPTLWHIEGLKLSLSLFVNWTGHLLLLPLAVEVAHGACSCGGR